MSVVIRGDHREDWVIKNDSSEERERGREREGKWWSLPELPLGTLKRSSLRFRPDCIPSFFFPEASPSLLGRNLPPTAIPAARTHAHTPPTWDSSPWFWRFASKTRFACFVFSFKSCLWWKAERRWWCWQREVSLARAALICRKPSGAPCENHQASRATEVVWVQELHPIPATGAI